MILGCKMVRSTASTVLLASNLWLVAVIVFLMAASIAHAAIGRTSSAIGQRYELVNDPASVKYQEGVVAVANQDTPVQLKRVRKQCLQPPCPRRSRKKRTTAAGNWTTTSPRTVRSVERTNLCDTNECQCIGKQVHDLTVQCNFTKTVSQ